METLEENETPEILKETVIPRPVQPENNETQCEGRRRADIETPDRPEPVFNNPWTLLPFAEATWRPTYRVRDRHLSRRCRPPGARGSRSASPQLSSRASRGPRPCVYQINPART